MCSLFIANTNEKWAHPLHLGFSLLANFLSPCSCTTTFPFLTERHLERVMVTTQPQERQVSAPKDHADFVKTLRTRSAVGVLKTVSTDVLNTYIYILLWPSVIKVRKKTVFCSPNNPHYYSLTWCPDFIITSCQVRTCHVFICIFACVVWQLQFFINSQQCFPGILFLW